MTTTQPWEIGDALSLHTDTVREVMPNGLTLLVRRDRSAPVVAIVTHVKAGYFDEPDDVVGIAHVLEHMYFKGTPGRGVGQIARETKANGGYLNAHTIYDHTSYVTVLPAASFEQGLDIQFDAFAHSHIDADELARELEVIVQEVKRKRDTPSAVAIESLYAVMHDRHRIRRWRIGDEDALRTLSRAQLLAFYRYWYRPANTILSIVGDVDADVVRRAVDARYGLLDGGAPTREPGPVETSEAGFRAREWSGDLVQQQLAFGWRTPPLTDSDAPALELAGIALGNGRASRLYRAVREHQWASSVSAWHYTAGNIGVFVAHAESPSTHAANATTAMWREVQAARSHGLRPSEVRRAQRAFETRWLRRLETMDGQASYLASWEADGGLELASTYYDRVLSLRADVMHGALQRHLDPTQASVVSYRPTGAPAVAESTDAWRLLLREVEGYGSRVLPPTDQATPEHSPVVEAPTVVSAPTFDSLQHGVHVFRTARGVPLLIKSRPGAPLAHIAVCQCGGSISEPAGTEGLARLTAHAMLKGTSTRSGARVAEDAEALGSSIGVSAALESLTWSMCVPPSRLGSASTLLADVLQHPVFADDDVHTERALAIAEVARLRDDMFRWPMRLATDAAFAGHPYARSVIGTEDSLALLDAEALRRFHREQVLHADTVIAVVGDVQPGDVATMLCRHFDEMQWRAPAVEHAFTWPSQAIFRHDTREKQQTAIALLFPGPARSDPQRIATQLLSAITSGLGGRFFEQLRDKQSLAYTVAAFPIERRDAGAFGAYIATAPSREEEARVGLLSEFAKLCAAAPLDEELERACRYLIGTHQIAQQSSASVLGEMIDAWLFGSGLHELGAYVEQLRAVSSDDVLQVARRYFDPERRVEGIVRGTATAQGGAQR